MNIIDNLLATLPDGQVREVRVGAFRTAVVVEVAVRSGLSVGSGSQYASLAHLVQL